MAVPGTINLSTIRRGDTYVVDMFFVDTDGSRDITNVTIEAQARREIDGSVWFELNPIKIDPENGHFRIHLTSEQTRNITENPLNSYSGIYDIQFSWAGVGEVYVSTVVAGTISISKDITQTNVTVPELPDAVPPTSNQDVEITAQLNFDAPYTDEVLVESLGPNLYSIVASLGLANIDYITICVDAANAAIIARDEAEVFRNEAEGFKNTATTQAGISTQEANRAKAEADRAEEVAGLDTVDDAVELALTRRGALIYGANVISTDQVIPANNNAQLLGPTIEIADGYSIDVGDGSILVLTDGV